MLFRYHFSFVSLVSPLRNAAIRWNFRNDFPETLYRQKSKLGFKDSYMLLSWLRYLTYSFNGKDIRNIRFSCLPVRKKVYGFQKAPMAHKTNSQQHFKFRFYFFRLSFKAYLQDSYLPQHFKAGLSFIFLIKKLFPFFETNLLFLKSYRLEFYIYNTQHLKYL